MIELASFQRRFEMWEYAVSHSLLLLRSVKTPALRTRIDLLFLNVQFIQCETSLENLEVLEGGEMPCMPRSRHKHRVFTLQASDFSGVVVAGAGGWREDDGEYFDQSGFGAWHNRAEYQGTTVKNASF